jgi:hypothetical protein
MSWCKEFNLHYSGNTTRLKEELKAFSSPG